MTAYKDGTNPVNVSLSIGTKTVNSIPVTASGTDSTSGIASYRFDYKLSTSRYMDIRDSKSWEHTYIYRINRRKNI